MKSKIVTAIALFTMMCNLTFGQALSNSGFENWALDTNYLSLTTPPLLDTTITMDPLSWTTSNELTNGSFFHHKVFVTQSNTSFGGSSSVQMTSDSLHATISSVFGTINLNFVCPAFIISGKFPINLSSIAGLSGSFNPATLPGAGIPVTGRKSKIGGYLKFQSVGGDSAYVVAILRKGTTVVAQATYLQTASTSNYTYFEAPFIYQSCMEPDTMVYTLSSGNPYSIGGIVIAAASGNPASTGQHVGSTLIADSLFLQDSIPGFTLPPFTVNDVAQVLEHSSVRIPVGLNDQNCYLSQQMNVAISATPSHGSVSVSGDTILYTPDTNFHGIDTFYYTSTVGSSAPSRPTMVIVTVTQVYGTGVSEVSDVKPRLYPNPASSKLHISSVNTSISHVKVIDMLGKEVRSENFSGDITLDVSSYTNGLYIVQFSTSEGKLLSSSRFTVLK